MAISFESIRNFFLGSASGTLDANFAKIKNEFSRVIYRDGSARMTGSLDMDGRRIINHGLSINANDLVTRGEVESIAGSISAGPSGPSNNTRLTLAALRAAPTTDKTSLYDNSLWTWTLGDYSALVTSDPLNYVKADLFATTTGAWMRAREAKTVPYAVPYNRILSDRSLDRITLKDFGSTLRPVGADNATWDTEAVQRAVDFMANYRLQTVSPNGSNVYTGPALCIPAGRYRFNDSATALISNAPRILFRGEGRDSTVLVAPSGKHLFTSTDRLESVFLGDMTIVGGKGGFHSTLVDSNVSQFHIFEDLLFFDYSGSAIASESVDMPYFSIARCTFAGGPDLNNGLVRGVVIGGLQDTLLIQNNAFVNNDYGLVLGPLASGSWHVKGNDFISQYIADRTRADIWLRPKDGTLTPAGSTYRYETGNGSSIADNKFGNEGITSWARKAPKILVAAGVGGTDRTTAQPDLSWKNGLDGTHLLGGLTVSGNRFVTANTSDSGTMREGADASVMDVYVNGLDRIKWLETNSYDGSSFKYVVNHVSNGARQPNSTNMNWDVRIPASGVPARLGFTNSPVGHIVDYSGTNTDPYTIDVSSTSDRTAVALATIDTPDAWQAAAGTTKAATANIDGANDATLFTFTGAPTSIAFDLPGPMTANVGRAGFIQFLYKLAPGQALTRFTLYVNAAGRDIKVASVTLSSSGAWTQTPAIPCPWPSDAAYARFTLVPVDHVNGTAVTIGDVKFTAGKKALAIA